MKILVPLRPANFSLGGSVLWRAPPGVPLVDTCDSRVDVLLRSQGDSY